MKTVPQVPFADREGLSFGVEVLDLGELRNRQLNHSVFRAHRIEFHILVLFTAGNGWHMVDFAQHPVRRGTVVHIAPGQVLRYDGENNPAGFLVLFQPELCGLEAPHVRWPPMFRPTTEDFELLESLVQIMFDLKAHPSPLSLDRFAWRMLSAVLELSGASVDQHLLREGAPHSDEFEAFNALLNENFTQHRDLSWYADELGYSEKTISRWCLRVVGSTAKKHIDQRVALEAKRLLVHARHTVETIAYRLGFSEPTNFVKFFKRIEGTTPSAFRNHFDRRLDIAK